MIYRVYRIDPRGHVTYLQEYKSKDAATKRIDALIKKDGPDGYNDYDYECVYPAHKVKGVTRE